MIRLAWLFWLALALPATALAQPVQVTSGEHDGFTRLVLDYGSPVDWQIGRTTDGYEVRLPDATPRYDLTGVYDAIGRGRLASVWVDPESGGLRLGIGCSCHAQPFEFRPGIVVIDLKDGPPPKGSSFETALSGETLDNLAARPVPRPRARPAQVVPEPASARRVASYDWTARLFETEPKPLLVTDPQIALPQTDSSLQPLRDVLLHQLSRGVAQGVVEMVPPKTPPDAAPQRDPVRIRLHDIPGVNIGKDADGQTGLSATGATCVTDDRLDIAAWGTERPIAEQMPEALAGLVGEFDAPDPEAELRAVRFLLFISFGAEARQILTQVSTNQPDAVILTSMGHILDDNPDPTPAFTGMAACDTAAALWAILGDPAPERGAAFDRAAALRSFSALPVHLRRLLGPRLVDRFLGLDDAPAAEEVRDAIMRAPGDAGPEVAVMEARLDLDSGEAEIAEDRLAPLIDASGPATPEALLALVAAHLAQRTPIDAGQLTALEAMLHERGNTSDAARFAVALTQARALAGDFDGAMAELAAVPEAAQDVWALLAELGPNSALLAHAVLPSGAIPRVSAPVATALARRLSELGFAEQAGDWLRTVPEPEPELAARVALQNNDARATLDLLAGSDDPALLPLRTEALSQLADEAALADVLASTGDEDARWRAVGRARDWQKMAAFAPAPWQSVAAVVIGNGRAEDASAGPLAQGQVLLEQSAQTRTQIAELLSVVAGPTSPGQ